MGDKTFLNTAWKNQCQDEVVVLNGKIAVALNTAETHVTIPEGVTILADYLFSDGDRNVMTVDLPQSLTVWAWSASCTNLQEITFPRNLKADLFLELLRLQVAEVCFHSAEHLSDRGRRI